jgi:hypothetical protein
MLYVRSSIAGEKALQHPHVYLDGNFRLPHIKRAGSATHHDPPIRHRFAEDEKVREFCIAPSSSIPAAQPTECNDFDADKAIGRVASNYDITGVAAAFCRHGFLLLALNMFTGERWAYATFILQSLFLAGIVPSFVWWVS